MGTQRMFNAPPGVPSSIGPQLVNEFYQKTALIELVKEVYFGQLADVTSMPKNMGKKIVRYHYLPLLDDANMNDQGIDAAGVVISMTSYYVSLPGETTFTTQAAADTQAGVINGYLPGAATVVANPATSYAPASWTMLVSRNVTAGMTEAASAVILAAVPGSSRVLGSGNLYGSSKDVGVIAGKMPILSETGGRVNRVGFKRKTLEGTFAKFGFFDEYTQESMDFDTDADLMMHINREMLRGANEITEDALQIDLLNGAGIVRFAGDATNKSEIGANDVVTYGDLMRLSIDLDNNRTPKQTKMITGSRMIDTRVIPAGRILFMGSELIPTIMAMTDLHDNPAYISIEKYAAAGNTVTGEQGTIGQFKVVIVPEMMHWTGAGAAVAGDAANYDNGTHFNVYPMLVVGDESFTTIGFQTDGKTVKFKITHKPPGEETADRTDPYGETGFMSIKWYYGFMLLRPERIALILTVARL